MAFQTNKTLEEGIPYMTEGTIYPILLLHGMGFRDFRRINYWGRIPGVLGVYGAKVFYGNQDANGSVETNALQIEMRLKEILRETGAAKVNIIAHSKGGIEARYLISTLKHADEVASLTTISTPHNGSVTVDHLLKFPKFLVKFGCFLTDIFFRILGDKNPKTYSSVCSLTTKVANQFNLDNPDSDKVYYQSYAFVMKNIFSDGFFWLSWLLVRHYEGESDGLLSPRAVKWGNFRGIYKSNGRRGISHCDEVDLRRRRFTKKTGDGISDITEIYLKIYEDLCNMGF